jgi:hypothetical protein
MRVCVRFYSGRWADGVIRDRLLHVDGYTFTRGMVKANGWEVVRTYPSMPLDVPKRGDSEP